MTQYRQMRWFGHPAVVGALLALLVIDFLSIPSGNTHRSTIHRALLGDLGPNTAGGQPLFGDLYRAGGELEWVWRWDDRFEAIARGEVEGYEDLNALVFFHLVRFDGLYHLTHRTETLTIECERLTPDEWRQVAQHIASAIAATDQTRRMYQRQHELLALAPTNRAADRQVRVRRTPLLAGRFRNAAAIAVFGLAVAAFIFGRTWLWDPFRWRCRSRLQRGLCSACGYDLAGLASADPPAPCPECGARSQTRPKM